MGQGCSARCSRSSRRRSPAWARARLTQTGSTEASILNVQAGFSWAPSEAWRFTFGYTYEHWWDTAFTSLNNSHGDVWTQGVFFRGEWKY